MKPWRSAEAVRQVVALTTRLFPLLPGGSDSNGPDSNGSGGGGTG
ncbi:hypothetical protein EDD99_3791 [Streptomyces sp. 846.5]|nr:hypothetical protein [Streptomyces sp. 846.5]TDU05284.1 hypothetical protein EDD99_3791 [Streptomyces sp. 846.5]